MATLYIFVGNPGAGKTTVSNIICEATHAAHIWADRERQAMFGKPSHSQDESNNLYQELNNRTRELLLAGRNVVFDTNFNYRKDRDHLRAIAADAKANLVIVEMVTPLEVARERALQGSHAERNGMPQVMTPETFQRIVDHREPLGPDEHSVKLDGTDTDKATVLAALGLS